MKEMEDNKVTNGKCWVAYFDILGFSDIIEHFEPEGVLEKYNEVLKEIKKQVDSFNVNCKFFSDSFVFYTEDDSERSFRSIDATLRFFFRNMFIRYIPMRGCLNVGDFYVDEEKGIFFGRSLVEAHSLAEGQNWIGFIVSEKVMEKLDGFNAEDSEPYRNDFKNHYINYQVPCKKNKECKLFVFKLDINPYQQTKQEHMLLNTLERMEDIAEIHLNKKEESNGSERQQENRRNIMIKYENTKDFLLYVYPELKKKA